MDCSSKQHGNRQTKVNMSPSCESKQHIIASRIASTAAASQDQKVCWPSTPVQSRPVRAQCLLGCLEGYGVGEACGNVAERIHHKSQLPDMMRSVPPSTAPSTELQTWFELYSATKWNGKRISNDSTGEVLVTFLAFGHLLFGACCFEVVCNARLRLSRKRSEGGLCVLRQPGMPGYNRPLAFLCHFHLIIQFVTFGLVNVQLICSMLCRKQARPDTTLNTCSNCSNYNVC
jgi:hypothetical protein